MRRRRGTMYEPPRPQICSHRHEASTIVDHRPERDHLTMMTSLMEKVLVAAETLGDLPLAAPMVTATASEVGSMLTIENDARTLVEVAAMTTATPEKTLVTCSGQLRKKLVRQISRGK